MNLEYPVYRIMGAMAVEFDIAVRILDPAWRRTWPKAIDHVRRAARTALDVIASGPTAEKGPAIELAIVLAGDDEVRRLNRDYRGIDKSTNVLSFGDASDGRRRARGEPVILGDVVLARETVAEEAAAQGKSIADHSLHLVIHGILHLLGHVHESDREADAMEALEIDLLARLGVANPYAVRAGRRARRQV